MEDMMCNQEKNEQSESSDKFAGIYDEMDLGEMLAGYGLIMDNIVPLAITLTGPNQTMICVNSDESKELLQSEDGKEIVYVTLAHEIGHICDATKTKHHYEDTLEWRLSAEIKADEVALTLLQKIFDNSCEILMKQMDRALDKMFKIQTTQEKIDLAVTIHDARRNALMKRQQERIRSIP
jgi:hypothetical protein